MSFPATRRRVLRGLALGGFALAHETGEDLAGKRRGKKRRNPCGPCRKRGKKRCKVTVGAACANGGTCLSNGTCTPICTTVQECGQGCTCGLNVEGLGACIVWPISTCGLVPQECASTAECEVGFQCEAITCNGVPSQRCLPLCPS